MKMIQNRQGRMVPELWASRDEHYRIKDNLMIGSDDFGSVILAALYYREPLSVVRMSDGEDELLLYCKSRPAEELVPNRQFPMDWQKRLGFNILEALSPATIKKLRDLSLVIADENHIRTTNEGRLLLNSITSELLTNFASHN